MALICCPECSQQISDQAAACPHCGYPLQARQIVPTIPPADEETRIRETLLSQGKIMAVKLCRDLHPGMGLADAKARVDRLEAELPGATVRPASAGCLSIVAMLVLPAAGWGICVRLAFFG